MSPKEREEFKKKLADQVNPILIGDGEPIYMMDFKNGTKELVTKFDSREYWKRRAELAEKYISECPCDPDIYSEQQEAYNKWQEIKKVENDNQHVIFIPVKDIDKPNR